MGAVYSSNTAPDPSSTLPEIQRHHIVSLKSQDNFFTLGPRNVNQIFESVE